MLGHDLPKMETELNVAAGLCGNAPALYIALASGIIGATLKITGIADIRVAAVQSDLPNKLFICTPADRAFSGDLLLFKHEERKYNHDNMILHNESHIPAIAVRSGNLNGGGYV